MSCIKPQGLVMRLPSPVACTMEARRAAVATFIITSEFVPSPPMSGTGW
jgi:hypothetical protein